MGNRVMWMLLGVMIAALVLQVLSAAALVGAPRAALLQLCAEDGELGVALARADRGDTTLLATWLVRAQPLQRKLLVQAQLGLIELAGPPGPEGRPLSDDASIWPFRHRLRALSAVSCGDASLDYQVVNALAYVLTTGQEQPGAADVAFAGKLADRLERRMRADPAHGGWDTIACVRFRQGDWGRAKTAWASAQELLAKEDAGPLRTLLEGLYRARFEAAAHNLNPPPHAAAKPLPRELRGASVPTAP